MAREHVGEESNRMRERPHEDVGDQLDRGQQDVHGLGDTRREHHVGEELDWALLDHAQRNPGEVHDESEGHGNRKDRCRRQLCAGQDPEEVQDPDEEEEAEQERDEFLASGPDGLFGDSVANEDVPHLADVLGAAGDQLGLAERVGEETNNGDDTEEQQHRDLREAELQARQLQREDVLKEEDLGTWSGEAASRHQMAIGTTRRGHARGSRRGNDLSEHSGPPSRSTLLVYVHVRCFP